MLYEYMKHKNFPEYYNSKENLRAKAALLNLGGDGVNVGDQLLTEQNELKKYKETLMKLH